MVTEEAACLPDPEPGELFEDVNVQLFGLDGDPARRPRRAARYERVRR